MEPNGPPLSPAQGMSQHTAPTNSEALVPTGSLEDVQAQGAMGDTGASQEIIIVPPRRNHWFRWTTIGLVICLLIGGGIFIAKGRNGQRSELEAGHFGTISLPLKDLQAPTASAYTAKSLQINGELQIAGSVQFSPDSKPVDPQAGQLYYDKNTHQLGYYDGTGFVYMQGGATTSITNNYTTGPTVYNITNVNGGGVAATGGTAGHLAMFTAANTLGDSLISQSGNDIAILTTDQTGTSGNIVIQSGASSTTASGNVDMDTGPAIITGTLVGTNTFESGLDNIIDGFGYHDTLTSSTAEAHSGTHSLAVTVGLGPLNLPEWKIENNAPFQGWPVTAGHKYAFSAWVRAGSSSSDITANAIWSSNGFEDLTQEVPWGTITDVSTGWKQVSGILTAPAGDNYVLFEFDEPVMAVGSVGDVHYFDDMSLTDLTSSAAIAQVNIGSAHAQQVTIGNINQINATSIYGSGVTIDGGLGNTSLSGGAVTISGHGNSSFMSNGNLTLQAATTSSWGIGASGGSGGSLTIHAGTAGGNNDGGNLTLESGGGSGVNGVSGDINIDTQASAVDGTLVDDRTFETGADNILAWYGDTVSQTNSAARQGSYSLSEVGTGGQWAIGQDNNAPAVPAVAGHKYFFSAYVRAFSIPDTICSNITWNGAAGGIALNCVTDTSSGGWTQMTGTGTAPPGATGAYWHFYGSESAGEEHMFDDLTVTDLSTATSTADINVGAIQAQKVTIGNMNEVGPTTIQGGSGIAIDSGESNLNLTGNIITKPQIDSSVAFVMQNSAGTDLFTADTADMTITIYALAITTNITVDGHIVTGGLAPTIVAGAAACTTPTVSVSGTDTSGTITVTTGTACATSGALATVTFVTAFGAAPHVIVTPGGSNSLALGAYVDDSTVSTTSFTLGTNGTPANSTAYRWNYLATQ